MGTHPLSLKLWLWRAVSTSIVLSIPNSIKHFLHVMCAYVYKKLSLTTIFGAWPCSMRSWAFSSCSSTLMSLFIPSTSFLPSASSLCSLSSWSIWWDSRAANIFIIIINFVFLLNEEIMVRNALLF